MIEKNIILSEQSLQEKYNILLLQLAASLEKEAALYQQVEDLTIQVETLTTENNLLSEELHLAHISHEPNAAIAFKQYLKTVIDEIDTTLQELQ